MPFTISRILLFVSLAGLFLIWLVTVAFYTTDRLRSFVVASGIIFFLILTVLIFSFRGLIRSFHNLSKSARLALPVLASGSPARHSANEIEFVSETFSTVVEQLQAKQLELNELHAKLGERAASAEAFSQYVVSSLPSGLIAFDLEGLIRVINQPAREIFELPPGFKVISNSYQDLFKSNSTLLQIITDSLTNNIFVSRTEVNYRTQSKHIRRLGLTVAPLEVNAQVAGVLCLISDITEINQLREQMALRQNLESLGLMSAGLAHQFKNSLATLHIYAQFLSRHTIDKKSLEAVTGLTQEIKGLSEMVTAFLNFSRPQSLLLSPVSLEQLLTKGIMEASANAFEDEVKFELRGSFPLCIGDQILLQQVFGNLFQNAHQATLTNHNSNNLVVIKGSLEVDQAGENWVKIEIEDDGVGIKPEDLPYVFIPFFTTKSDGHGIGLALSHRIITQHGGTLTAENSVTGGALFVVKLKAQLEA